MRPPGPAHEVAEQFPAFVVESIKIVRSKPSAESGNIVSIHRRNGLPGLLHALLRRQKVMLACFDKPSRRDFPSFGTRELIWAFPAA